MPDITLPVGIRGDKDIPKLRESLTNLFNPGDNTLLRTPGRSLIAAGEGYCRGSIDFQGVHYQISGSQLTAVDDNGLTTVIGPIPGTAQCALSKSFISLMIVVKGEGAYSFDGTTITLVGGSYKPAIDVAAINGRFVFVPEDGGPVFYTDVNAPTTIPALNFFDAELFPDKNTGIINLKNDLFVGGETSFEPFRDTGNTDAPFARTDGAAVETGYVAGMAKYKDTFLFLGRDVGGAYAFHAMASGDAPKISNPAIEEMLNEDFTPEQLEGCLSQRFTWKGIDMVSFRLPTLTLLFYGTGWAYIASGINSDDKPRPWDINHLAFSYGRYYCGSAIDSSITVLDNSLTEVDARIERQIETFAKSGRDTYFTINSLMLDCITGTAAVEGTVALSISKDGRTYGPRVSRPLGKQGKYQQQVNWYGGVGHFESFCGIRLRTTAAVDFAMDGLKFNG